MKNLSLVVLVFFFSLSYGQELTAKIDYTVDYTIPNKKKKTIDTISVGFDKSGKYLWSNYNGLAKELSKDILKNRKYNDRNLKSSFLFDSKNLKVYISMNLENSSIFFDLDLNDIIPNENDPLNENFVLETSKTKNKIKIMGKKYAEYDVYPSNDQKDKIKMVVNSKLSVNNNNIFNRFINLMLNKTNSDGSFQMNLPDGLILAIKEKEEFIIKAIKVDSTVKNITINHSFKITK